MENMGDNRRRRDVFPAVGVMHLATSKLITRLCPPGKEPEGDPPGKGVEGIVLDDGELETLCGRNCAPGHAGYGNLQSAKRYCLREYGVVWERLPGAGAIKCVTPGETVKRAHSDASSIARRAKRTVKKLRAQDKTGISDTDRGSLAVLGAQLGTIAMMASKGTTAKLEARNVQEPLDMGRLLEAMKRE